MKKITEEQITHLESWYNSMKDKDKKNMKPEEKEIFNRVKGFVDNNWQGVRIPKSETTKLEEQYERLMRKGI